MSGPFGTSPSVSFSFSFYLLPFRVLCPSLGSSLPRTSGAPGPLRSPLSPPLPPLSVLLSVSASVVTEVGPVKVPLPPPSSSSSSSTVPVLPYLLWFGSGLRTPYPPLSSLLRLTLHVPVPSNSKRARSLPKHLCGKVPTHFTQRRQRVTVYPSSRVGEEPRYCCGSVQIPGSLYSVTAPSPTVTSSLLSINCPGGGSSPSYYPPLAHTSTGGKDVWTFFVHRTPLVDRRDIKFSRFLTPPPHTTKCGH